jgi:S1-C subfamily serine protease
MDAAGRAGSASVYVLEHAGRPVGTAALVDKSGLLIAHASAHRGAATLVRIGPSMLQPAIVVAQDSVTQTVLIQVVPIGLGNALPVAKSVKPGAVVLAVGATRQASGQITAVDRVGQVRPSLRYMPLSEVWLESGDMGSSILLDHSGAVVGILSATLGMAESDAETVEASAAAKYGPSALQVSYAVSPSILSRVVEGFLSPGRQVMHPTIGVFFRMSAGAGGVILESVQPGSSSEAAGLRAGDKIVSVDGKPVVRSTDLAAILFATKPGQRIEVGYERDGSLRSAVVTVQGQDPALMCRTIQRQHEFPL